MGTGDDFVYTLRPRAELGSDSATIEILEGYLPPGLYRFTVSGTTTIHDLAGMPLDGDRTGTGGVDYVRTFTVAEALLDFGDAPDPSYATLLARSG